MCGGGCVGVCELGMYSTVHCVLSPGGRVSPSFIHQVIIFIITRLNKYEDCNMLSP